PVPAITMATGEASTRSAAMAKALTWPSIPPTVEKSPMTAAVPHSPAPLASAAYGAVAKDAALHARASMNRREDFEYAAVEASPSPGSEAPDATLEMPRSPRWPMSMAAKGQNATLPAEASPTPRKPKVGLYLKPIRLSGQMRMRAWAATPRVAVPAMSAILSGVQVDSSWGEALFVPKMRMKTASPPIATMLLSTGAHMYGPKDDFALSTWPSSV